MYVSIVCVTAVYDKFGDCQGDYSLKEESTGMKHTWHDLQKSSLSQQGQSAWAIAEERLSDRWMIAQEWTNESSIIK